MTCNLGTLKKGKTAFVAIKVTPTVEGIIASVFARIDEQADVNDRYQIEVREPVQDISAEMIIGAAENDITGF